MTAALDQERIDRVLEQHRARAGNGAGAAPVRLFQAPGRVNLLGEHTDYSGGFCMPAALTFNTLIAASSRADRALRMHSLDFDKTAEVSLDDLAPNHDKKKDWSAYVAGVAWSLMQAGEEPAGRLVGADLTITGNVPLGAGLSSSASIEVATATALLALAGRTMPKPRVALACQRAENDFVGAPCGIMDQFISASGLAGHALALDTRALTAELAPIPSDLRLVVANSMVKHSVAEGGEYAKVRGEVEEAAHALHEADPKIAQLRDATLADLEANRGRMSDDAFHRGRHVITDSGRVLEGLAALRAGDVARFGRLMVEAHASYRDDFRASCRECDILVELAVALPGCLGSRLTGGGFGGCTVSLVRAEASEAFMKALRAGYQERTGKVSDVYLCETADGASELELRK